MQRQRNVVRRLATHRNHHARRLLHLINVHHGLERDVLKVQSVRLIVVGRHGLGVVVHHDRLEALRTQCADRTHRTPIELNRRANPVHTRAQYHDAVVLKVQIMLHGVVRCVQVVRLRRELGCDCVDLLHERRDAQLLPSASHGELRAGGVLGDLVVREAQLLRTTKQVRWNLRCAAVLHGLGGSDDALELAQEPAVNVAQLVDVLDRPTTCERIGHSKDAPVRRELELFVDLGIINHIILAETSKRRIDRPDGFLHTFLECATNGHHLAHTLHAAAQLRAHAHELAQVPTGDLSHHIVETGLEACTRLARHRVAQLVQWNVETQLGGDER